MSLSSTEGPNAPVSTPSHTCRMSEDTSSMPISAMLALRQLRMKLYTARMWRELRQLLPGGEHVWKIRGVRGVGGARLAVQLRPVDNAGHLFPALEHSPNRACSASLPERRRPSRVVGVAPVPDGSAEVHERAFMRRRLLRCHISLAPTRLMP